VKPCAGRVSVGGSSTAHSAGDGRHLRQIRRRTGASAGSWAWQSGTSTRARRWADGRAGRWVSACGAIGLCSRELWVSQPAMGVPHSGVHRGGMIERERSSELLVELLSRIRDARFSHGLRCPRCRATRVQRWGMFSGRQRYRCGGCGRTFSDLTGTPASYSKKLLEWERYRRVLAEGMSVRRAGALLGLHPATAFRWRHALLAAVRARDDTVLRGWIELGDVGFAYSEKGRRDRDRPARRGSADRWRIRRAAVVKVVVACDRLGGVMTVLLPWPSVRVTDVEASLEKRLGSRVVIVARQGRLGPYARFARRRGSAYQDARGIALRPTSTLTHVRTVKRYVRRLLGWMPRFRGVATKYLPHYLAWHRMIDRSVRLAFEAVVLRWPLSHDTRER